MYKWIDFIESSYYVNVETKEIVEEIVYAYTLTTSLSEYVPVFTSFGKFLGIDAAKKAVEEHFAKS